QTSSGQLGSVCAARRRRVSAGFRRRKPRAEHDVLQDRLRQYRARQQPEMSATNKIVFATLFFGAALLATEPNQETRRWWSHVQALANDGMEGRDTGSEGYRKAASYVARQFEQNGLKPAGEQGY